MGHRFPTVIARLVSTTERPEANVQTTESGEARRREGVQPKTVRPVASASLSSLEPWFWVEEGLVPDF